MKKRYFALLFLAATAACKPHVATLKDAQRINVIPQFTAEHAVSEQLDISFPAISISEDGAVVITWTTKQKTAADFFNFGICYSNSVDAAPMLNHSETVTTSKDGKEHSVTLRIPDVEWSFGATPYQDTIYFMYSALSVKANSLVSSSINKFSYAHTATVDGSGMVYLRRPTVIEGPLVCNLTADSAAIMWRTDIPTTPTINIAGRHIEATYKTNRHILALSGLKPDAIYMYAIAGVDDHERQVNENNFSFHTFPRDGKNYDFSFAVFADTYADSSNIDVFDTAYGVNTTAPAALAHNAYNNDARFIVCPGGLINGNTPTPDAAIAAYRTWKETMSPVWSHIPVYTGMGANEASIYRAVKTNYLDYTRNDRTAVLTNAVLHFPQSGNNSPENIFASEFVNPANGPGAPAEFADHPFDDNVYSFNFGSCKFIMLNNDWYYCSRENGDPITEFGYQGLFHQEVTNWLRAELSDALKRNCSRVFVFFHEPAFPNSAHIADAMSYNEALTFGKNQNAYPAESFKYAQFRDKVWRMLCEGHVTAVFTGRENAYHRTLIDDKLRSSFYRDIWQIGIGTGGAMPEQRRIKTFAGSFIPWQQIDLAGSQTVDNLKAYFVGSAYALVSTHNNKTIIEIKNLSGQTIDSVTLK